MMRMLGAVSLVVVLGLCTINPSESSCTSDKVAPALNRTDDTPIGILKLLNDGERLLDLHAEDRELVVFMGITGSGKTTFVLHIGGNDDDLTSVETRPHSGEFLISDQCNRSSSASKTLESFTLVPDRIVDTETRITFYDMPGFSDTRPLLAYDIAATYLSKRVLDHARRIKLVFVVNHSHLKVGEDRGRFTELVDHITTLIRDLSKFKDSIALIVSKVTNVVLNPVGGDFPYVSDEDMVEGIAEFIRNAKSFYMEDNRIKAAELMDIFLEKKNNSYARIGLFRRPDRPGPLINVTSIQRNKRALKEIINSNIRFAEKNVDDFWYTLSEKSKNMLHQLKEEVMRNATETIRHLGEIMKAHFILRETSADDLEEMIRIFNDSPTEAAIFTKIADFANYMEGFAKRLGVNITANSTKDLRDNERIMGLLIGMRGEATIDWTSTIRNGTSEMTDYLQHSKAWYILFLNTMYDTLASFKVQRTKSTDNNNFAHLLTEINQYRRTPRKMNLTQLTALRPFLNKIGSEALLRIYDSSLGPIDMNERKLLYLEKVLDTTLNPTVDRASCVDGNLTVQGRYVLVSRVVTELDKCPPGLRFIEILALEKIFIDTGLNLVGKGIEVFMIAPVLQTVGRVEITLDGAAGQEFGASARHGQNTASDLARSGGHGDVGSPGGSAGHFIAIGVDFIDSDQLIISARGGTGGTGQRGGDGYRGADSIEAQSFSGTLSERQRSNIWSGHRINSETYYSTGFWRGFGYVLGVAKDKHVYRLHVYAIPGKHGGNGGRGGAGGTGGHRGQIAVINFNNGCQPPMTKMMATDGDRGAVGKGGRGAEGGRTGLTLVEKMTIQTYWWSDEVRELNYEGYTQPRSSDRTRDGEDGEDGANEFRRRLPTVVPFSGPDAAIDHFKTFARNNLISGTVRKNALKKILERLEVVANTTSGSGGSSDLQFEKQWRACCSSNCDRPQE